MVKGDRDFIFSYGSNKDKGSKMHLAHTSSLVKVQTLFFVILEMYCWINSIFYISTRSFIRKCNKGHRQGLLPQIVPLDETKQFSIIVGKYIYVYINIYI